MKDFNWKMKGLAHGVDPVDAVNELQRIQDVYGILTPEFIVNESANTESVLHPIIYNCDDEKAAYNYRLQLARILLNNIQVTIVTDGESKEISVYEVTSFKEGYKSIDSFTSADIEYIRNGILQDLIRVKMKLKLYREFDKILPYIEQAIGILDEKEE
jgi:hypothetical protein